MGKGRIGLDKKQFVFFLGVHVRIDWRRIVIRLQLLLNGTVIF
jgi:hypothetical protein|tara:strand:- start:594 stop:722 length:129 start_codon:yes stop_codon:yes gene_type:complete